MNHVLFAALRGAGMGMALNSMICLAPSYWLKLGYYAPCFVALIEPCGGELNGALIECLCAAILGAGLALLLPLKKRLHAHRFASVPVLLLVLVCAAVPLALLLSTTLFSL